MFEKDILNDENDMYVNASNTLVVGPENQRETFLKMINSAKKTIHIYQQSIQDDEMAAAIAKAASRGVDVHVVMKPYPFGGDKDPNIAHQDDIIRAGGTVHLNKKVYTHAKVMIIDGEDSDNKLMYMGSCNFYADSLDNTRELGLLIDDENLIRSVMTIYTHDVSTSVVKTLEDN